MASFKSLKLHEGLNILLSEKTTGATSRQTRNRAGKSSLIALIHFLLGSDCGPDSIFRNRALINETFSMRFDLSGQQVSVRRSGKKPSEVLIEDGPNPITWPYKPTAKGTVSNEHWRQILGELTFAIPAENDWGKWSPKYRQLISYFVRSQSSGGLVSPFKQAEKQSEGDSQIALSYLLGLDWTVSQQWQVLRDRERMLREISRSSDTDELGHIVGDPAELRTRLAVAEQRVNRTRDDVKEFNVVPEYHELESEANRITSQLGALADQNTIDMGLITDIEKAIETEHLPAYSDLDGLYREAGVQLSNLVLRQFAELEAFHRSVTDNRRLYLQGELTEARQRVAERDRSKIKLDSRRQEVMSILREGGALDQYVKLQAELARLEATTEQIRTRLETAEQLRGQQAENIISRTRLHLRLQQDLREQRARVDEAITTFEDVSSRLYEKAGSLIIDDTQNGPKFEVKIQGQKSKGVSSMQIFCFDIALMRLAAEKGIGPGFLIHDSHLFDGVDPRQTLTALQVGAEMSIEYGFQYFVTLNSDSLEAEKIEGSFDPWEYVNEVRLTDATVDGGLFGIRFD
jgi:uncharacterized protein YydD (DUF2326 family)